MDLPPLLTTVHACRVARMDRDRLNEMIAGGIYLCAPTTTAGRARLFDPDDMIALYLFRELMDDGMKNEKAAKVACAVAGAARANPDAKSITYVETYFEGHGDAYPTSRLPDPDEWEEVTFSGTDIRKTTTFNIGKMRKLIAHYTAHERRIIGSVDDE